MGARYRYKYKLLAKLCDEKAELEEFRNKLDHQGKPVVGQFSSKLNPHVELAIIEDPLMKIRHVCNISIPNEVLKPIVSERLVEINEEISRLEGEE